MSPGTSSIVFRVPARGVSRTKLRVFGKELQERVANGGAFCCLITNDAELRALNKQYRGKDYATDVLSFPATGPAESIGDIAISWDRAKAQAGEYGHTREQEIRILMLHGVLHLSGLDHETDRGEMARAEIGWRKRLRLPAGVIERVES